VLIIALVMAVIGLAALVTAVVTSNEVIAWVCIGASLIGVILLIVDAVRERSRPAAGAAEPGGSGEPESETDTDTSTERGFDADYPEDTEFGAPEYPADEVEHSADEVGETTRDEDAATDDTTVIAAVSDDTTVLDPVSDEPGAPSAPGAPDEPGPAGEGDLGGPGPDDDLTAGKSGDSAVDEHRTR
jgi:hypothetical protein